MGRASDGRWSDESAGDRRQRADRTARARRSAGARLRRRHASSRRARARRLAFNCADEDQFTLRQWVELAGRYAGGDLEIVGIPSAVARSAFAELLAPGSRPHMIVNTEKARTELGYVERVNAYDALRETVEWMIDNPIRLGEYPLYPAKFDYALDDRMIEEYRRAVDVLSRELGDEPPQLGHPMPHPKAPALVPDELGTDERGR
jgi:hypothetical protein